jgi:hypothetical protein
VGENPEFVDDNGKPVNVNIPGRENEPLFQGKIKEGFVESETDEVTAPIPEPEIVEKPQPRRKEKRSWFRRKERHDDLDF